MMFIHEQWEDSVDGFLSMVVGVWCESLLRHSGHVAGGVHGQAQLASALG